MGIVGGNFRRDRCPLTGSPLFRERNAMTTGLEIRAQIDTETAAPGKTITVGKVTVKVRGFGR